MASRSRPSGRPAKHSSRQQCSSVGHANIMMMVMFSQLSMLIMYCALFLCNSTNFCLRTADRYRAILSNITSESTNWHRSSARYGDAARANISSLCRHRQFKVDNAPQQRVDGCSSPSPRPWARRWRTTNVCDVWPVRRQTYGYLPSHKASPPASPEADIDLLVLLHCWLSNRHTSL